MHNPLNEQDVFFDVNSLSRYSSLSVRTLRDYLADPDDPIPSYCVRRKMLIKKSEFDAWLEKHRNKDKLASIVNSMLRDFLSN